MRYPLIVLLFTSFSAVQAQQLIFDEDFNTGIPAGWYIVDTDGLVPATAVDTFDNAWIPFIYDGDTCAASTSFYDPAGQSADYLITPRITLDAFSKLVWSARSYDASYPDGYVVLISVTDSLITSFTDTIYVKDEENYYWQTRSVQLDLEGYASQDVFIAFRNITTDGFVLMLDDVKVLSSDFAAVETTVQSAPYYSVYPNPAADKINLQGVPANTEVSCYSVMGQLQFTSRESSIDISALTPGCYYLRFSSADQLVTLPFIRE